jgi:hypothetical protein
MRRGEEVALAVNPRIQMATEDMTYWSDGRRYYKCHAKGNRLLCLSERCPTLRRRTGHENRHHNMMIRISATAPNGAYCRMSAWMFIFLAALRYLSDSERKEVDKCDIPVKCQGMKEEPIESPHLLSNESPLHKSSSMFLVMIRVTSCNSLFNLSKFDDPAVSAARVSWYSRAVFDIKVSEYSANESSVKIRAVRSRTKPDKGIRFPHRLYFGSVRYGEFLWKFF